MPLPPIHYFKTGGGYVTTHEAEPVNMKAFPIVVFQDGADFYLHINGVLFETYTAPNPVRDFHIAEAQLARAHFERFMQEGGRSFEWEGC
jgi:hypothetical protein